MSEILRPCPFCGSADIRTEPGINLNYCDKCSAEANIEHWNTRPIEDALNARIAELEAENKWLKAKYERLKAIAERVGLIIDNANDEFLRELQSIKLQQKRGPDLDEWGNRRHSNE